MSSKARFAVITFLTITFLNGFSDRAEAEVGVTENKIVLGTTFVYDGPLSARPKELFRGSDLVFKKVNAEGGINGRKIEIIKYNDNYKPEVASENVKKLAESDKVFALFQIFGAPTNRAIVPWLKRTNMLCFAPGTGGSEVREPVIKGTFNLRLGFAEEVEALVNYLVDKKGIKDFALLYQDDALGFGTRSGAQKALAARGLKLKAEASLAVGEKSGVDSAFAAIKASGAKAVIMGVNFAPAAAFAQKANKEKSNLVIGGSNNMMLAEYLKAAGPSAEGTVIFSTFPPQETQLELINKFKADLKDAKIAETSNIEGYLNALVFVEGLKRAGKNLTRDSLINAFESMKDVDFGGIKVSFSTTSHSGIDKGYLIVVKGGKFEVLRD